MRLVDIDAVLESFENTNEDIFACIDRAPTVESTPHAHWIPMYKANGQESARCSHCKKVYIFHLTNPSEFCPKCGAIMNEEVSE